MSVKERVLVRFVVGVMFLYVELRLKLKIVAVLIVELKDEVIDMFNSWKVEME